MNKSEMMKSMKAHTKGAEFISISAISRYTGKSREWVRQQITSDLPYLAAERTKKYYIGDVADRIIASLCS